MPSEHKYLRGRLRYLPAVWHQNEAFKDSVAMFGVQGSFLEISVFF